MSQRGSIVWLTAPTSRPTSFAAITRLIRVAGSSWPRRRSARSPGGRRARRARCAPPRSPRAGARSPRRGRAGRRAPPRCRRSGSAPPEGAGSARCGARSRSRRSCRSLPRASARPPSRRARPRRAGASRRRRRSPPSRAGPAARRPQPGRRAAGPAREGGDRLRRRDAPARRGRARREGGRADARGRLRQLRLDRERAPHRADPAPSGGADPLRRQRGGARRPALPRLGDRAPARGERGGAHRARLARRPPGLRADLRRGHELPATRMSRVIAAKLVGLEVGAVSQTIDPRWLMAYAAALGETDPRYYDTSAPSGPLAHPLFAVCYEWAVALTVRSKTIKPELMPLGVHTTHHLVIHRRPQAGDRLLTRGQLLTGWWVVWTPRGISSGLI